MKVKPKYVISILILFITISHCKSGLTNKLKQSYKTGYNSAKSALSGKGTKNPIKKGYNALYGTEAQKKLKTNTLGRKLTKGIGFAPPLKENDIDELIDLVETEADLIKMSAYKKLQWLYKNKKEITHDEKQKLISGLIFSARELLLFFGIKKNCPRMKLMLYEGLKYVKECHKINDKKGECDKAKFLLIESFYFSDAIIFNGLTKKWLRNAYNKAKKELPEDEELDYTEIKLACELKLAGENKNVLVKKITQFYLGYGSREKTINCASEMLKFKDSIDQNKVNVGEFYFLLARVFVHKNDKKSAIKSLNKVRNHPVRCEKDRFINKKAQNLLEKIYLQEHAKF